MRNFIDILILHFVVFVFVLGAFTITARVHFDFQSDVPVVERGGGHE